MAIEKPMCLPVNGKWVEYHPVTTPAMITGLEKFLVNTVYPVGSIFQTTTEDDPNELWPGTTWSKMDAGRVLVSAGTYTEGSDTYTYTLGDKGGEAKHQSTIEELAQHSHEAVTNTLTLYGESSWEKNGYGFKQVSSGIISCRDANNPAFHAEAGGDAGEGHNAIISVNATHGHTISVSNIGGSLPHENRQPYETVQRWKRIG